MSYMYRHQLEVRGTDAPAARQTIAAWLDQLLGPENGTYWLKNYGLDEEEWRALQAISADFPQASIVIYSKGEEEKEYAAKFLFRGELVHVRSFYWEDPWMDPEVMVRMQDAGGAA